MRKIFAWEFLTIDGVMESPEKWVDFYVNDEVSDFIKEENLACEALILGRITYEAFITFWPSQTHNEFGFAGHLNKIPKYVVTSTLKQADWNNSSIIQGENAMEEIAKLKRESGGPIGLTGSGTLIQGLLKEKLIDELHLLVHPIILGAGMRLFQVENKIPMKLIESRRYSSGVVLLSYRPE